MYFRNTNAVWVQLILCEAFRPNPDATYNVRSAGLTVVSAGRAIALLVLMRFPQSRLGETFTLEMELLQADGQPHIAPTGPHCAAPVRSEMTIAVPRSEMPPGMVEMWCQDSRGVKLGGSAKPPEP